MAKSRKRSGKLGSDGDPSFVTREIARTKADAEKYGRKAARLARATRCKEAYVWLTSAIHAEARAGGLLDGSGTSGQYSYTKAVGRANRAFERACVIKRVAKGSRQ